jgi:hypothetical protein
LIGDWVFRVELSFPQCAFLHHHEEDGQQDQDVDSGSNHAADDWRRNRLHHIGTNAGFPTVPAMFQGLKEIAYICQGSSDPVATCCAALARTALDGSLIVEGT